MRFVVVILLLAGSLVAWVLLTVPDDRGLSAIAEDIGEDRANCLIRQVNDNWPRRIIGPWAIEQSPTDGGRYRVFGMFGQSWEFWRSEGTLSTSGVRSTQDFGTSSCG